MTTRSTPPKAAPAQKKIHEADHKSEKSSVAANEEGRTSGDGASAPGTDTPQIAAAGTHLAPTSDTRAKATPEQIAMRPINTTISYPHPFFAREGWWFIAISAVIAVVTTNLWGSGSIPFWIIFIFIVQFFRDPVRAVPPAKNAILSPADGRIVVVAHCLDPYLQIERIKISVFMNVFNVHSNRSPVNAEVKEIHYHPGLFLNASVDKASDQNERNALILETADGTKITCIQIAGLIARRILCYTQAGKNLHAGERYGFIRFGSRVDIYVPPETQILVTAGQKVSATTTVLGILPSHH